MTKGTRKIIFFSTVAIVFGFTAYYLVFHKFKKNLNAGIVAKGKRADFIVDGFVYTVGTKAKSYPKSAGEFGGMIIDQYADDKSYWLAKNTKGQQILLKKTDVTIVI
jgi:hypothetical protein